MTILLFFMADITIYRIFFSDLKSPKLSKTPPPSPADFILRDQTASIQGKNQFQIFTILLELVFEFNWFYEKAWRLELSKVVKYLFGKFLTNDPSFHYFESLRLYIIHIIVVHRILSVLVKLYGILLVLIKNSYIKIKLKLRTN